jgi:hypothetical protein
MLNLYVDTSRVILSPEILDHLRAKLASGISCGAVILGEGGRTGCATLIWTFDGCVPVELVLHQNELKSREGVEHVAENFLALWRDRFAGAGRNGEGSTIR